jgi:hypothetical protein
MEAHFVQQRSPSPKKHRHHQHEHRRHTRSLPRPSSLSPPTPRRKVLPRLRLLHAPLLIRRNWRHFLGRGCFACSRSLLLVFERLRQTACLLQLNSNTSIFKQKKESKFTSEEFHLAPRN